MLRSDAPWQPRSANSCVAAAMGARFVSALSSLVRLVRDGLVSVQDAATSVGVDADEIRRALAAEG